LPLRLTVRPSTAEQKDELGRLLAQVPRDPQLLNAFKKDYPELAQQAEQLMKKKEQQQIQIRTMDHELEL
jgi:hypothetical protein